MMTRWKRFLLLMLTAFWLPVQTLTAFVMPLGLLALPAQAATHGSTDETEGALDAMPCHAQVAAQSANNADDDASLPNPDQACQQCGVCHLACAGYMPMSTLAPELALSAAVLIATEAAPLRTRFTEPPQHPPRA